MMNGHKWSHPYPLGFYLVFKKLGIRKQALSNAGSRFRPLSVTKNCSERL
jgi:hypothetical protein